MADVAVFTDSTCYLPAALADSLDITVISGYYDLGAGRVRDSDFDGDFRRFYTELAASKTADATSPEASVEEVLVVFDRLLAQHSAVVAILTSSGISVACAIAREAAARLESEGRGGERVVVIDSAASLGHMGVQVLAAARAAAAGQDRSGVIEAARRVRQEARAWVLLDTLEYLRRAGRIGTATAWIGSVLDLKPILTFEWEPKAVERVRTRRRGIERLVELMGQQRAVGADRWWVQHTGAHEEAQALARRLGAMFGTEPEFVAEVGPVGAVNLGPGALGAGGLPGAALDGKRG